MVDKTSLGVAVVAILIALAAIWNSTSMAGQIGMMGAVQGNMNTLMGDMSGAKGKLGTVDMRLGDLEAKVRGHNTPPYQGITVHFLTIENGKFYPDLIATYEGDNVKVNIVNKDAVERTFTIDALGGVNIKVPAGNASGVKDIIPMTAKLNAGIYRFYSVGDAPAGEPRAGGYLVVLRS